MLSIIHVRPLDSKRMQINDNFGYPQNIRQYPWCQVQRKFANDASSRRARAECAPQVTAQELRKKKAFLEISFGKVW